MVERRLSAACEQQENIWLDRRMVRNDRRADGTRWMAFRRWLGNAIIRHQLGPVALPPKD